MTKSAKSAIFGVFRYFWDFAFLGKHCCEDSSITFCLFFQKWSFFQKVPKMPFLTILTVFWHFWHVSNLTILGHIRGVLKMTILVILVILGYPGLRCAAFNWIGIFGKCPFLSIWPLLARDQGVVKWPKVPKVRFLVFFAIFGILRF